MSGTPGPKRPVAGPKRSTSSSQPGTGGQIGHWISAFLTRYVYSPSVMTFRSSERRSRPEGRFAELFLEHTGRRAEKWLHYCEIYDRLFDQFVDGFPVDESRRRPLRFLEIGTRHGGSLEIWRKFFGPTAIIYGIDVDPRCVAVGGPDLPVRIGSQDDPMFLASVVQEMGGVDVVLDDGSHKAAHQRKAFDTLFPLLASGGLYVVEDTHTSYWMRWGGGFRRPGTFIEVAKGMIDGLHKWSFRAPVGRRAVMASAEVVSIQFFDSIVALEKGNRQRPEFVMMGEKSF